MSNDAQLPATRSVSGNVLGNVQVRTVRGNVWSTNNAGREYWEEMAPESGPVLVSSHFYRKILLSISSSLKIFYTRTGF